MNKKNLTHLFIMILCNNTLIYPCWPWSKCKISPFSKRYQTEELRQAVSLCKEKRIENGCKLSELQSSIENIETIESDDSLRKQSNNYAECISILNDELLHDPTLWDNSKRALKEQQKRHLIRLKKMVDDEIKQN